MQLSVLTNEEIRSVVREELTDFFASFTPPTEKDEIGRGAAYASKITGKSVATIYSLVSLNAIPHSKQGKDLYFSGKELRAWLLAGRRPTQDEAARIANARPAFA